MRARRCRFSCGFARSGRHQYPQPAPRILVLVLSVLKRVVEAAVESGFFGGFGRDFAEHFDLRVSFLK
ncbi:MAG: hypothetical protein DKT66_24455 [Candidatus Melainabacteria bacterium]|nr:MAG: hypothetical protein DKT66_24455 [Candidatus Melainabacteria bacterium]